MRAIKILICIGVVFFAFSCKGTKDTCMINKPKDVQPIDWENYNDVYTVFWNYYMDCMEIWDTGDMLKPIKVYGWIFQGAHGNPINPIEFTLISNEEDIFLYNYSTRGGKGFNVQVVYDPQSDHNPTDSLRNKFATVDVTKKCYISGKLFHNQHPTNGCCWTVPEIRIYNASDIYFEEEQP